MVGLISSRVKLILLASESPLSPECHFVLVALVVPERNFAPVVLVALVAPERMHNAGSGSNQAKLLLSQFRSQDIVKCSCA